MLVKRQLDALHPTADLFFELALGGLDITYLASSSWPAFVSTWPSLIAAFISSWSPVMADLNFSSHLLPASLHPLLAVHHLSISVISNPQSNPKFPLLTLSVM
jgi:hypothetical protein